MIRLKPAQRFIEHFHCKRRVAAVCANFSHEKNFFAASLQSFSHPEFRLSSSIFPAVIEECDPAVDRLLYEFHRGSFVIRIAQMMTAETQRGNFIVVLAKFPVRHRCAGGGLQVSRLGWHESPEWSSCWGWDECPSQTIRLVRRNGRRNPPQPVLADD